MIDDALAVVFDDAMAAFIFMLQIFILLRADYYDGLALSDDASASL